MEAVSINSEFIRFEEMEYNSGESTPNDSEFEFPEDLPDGFSIGDLAAHILNVEKEIENNPKSEILTKNGTSTYKPTYYIPESIPNDRLNANFNKKSHFSNNSDLFETDKHIHKSSADYFPTNLHCMRHHSWRSTHSFSCSYAHISKADTSSPDPISNVCSCLNMMFQEPIDSNLDFIPSSDQSINDDDLLPISTEMNTSTIPHNHNSQKLASQEFAAEHTSVSASSSNSDNDDFGDFTTSTCNESLKNCKYTRKVFYENIDSSNDFRSNILSETPVFTTNQNESNVILNHLSSDILENNIQNSRLVLFENVLSTIFRVGSDSKIQDYCCETEKNVGQYRPFSTDVQQNPNDNLSSNLWNSLIDNQDEGIFDFSWKKCHTCVQYRRSIGIDLFNPSPLKLLEPTPTQSSTQGLFLEDPLHSTKDSNPPTFNSISSDLEISSFSGGFPEFPTVNFCSSYCEKQTTVSSVPLQIPSRQITPTEVEVLSSNYANPLVHRVLLLLPDYSFMLKSNVESPISPSTSK